VSPKRQIVLAISNIFTHPEGLKGLMGAFIGVPRGCVWDVLAMVRLQVALDYENLDDALKVAEKVAPYVDIMEVGTPLIKAEGIGAVKALKKAHPEKALCADLKTADAGYLEVYMAARASANIVTVLADAYNETLIGALKAAHEFGVEVMADLIVSRIPVSRLADIVGLDYKGTEIHYALVHSGLDRRAARRAPLSELDQVSRLRGHPCLAVAGGIRVADLPNILAYPVEIVIAGGGITKAKNPARAAKAFQTEIRKLTKKIQKKR
jgi:3-hexulose-6-phosphate synthase